MHISAQRSQIGLWSLVFRSSLAQRLAASPELRRSRVRSWMRLPQAGRRGGGDPHWVVVRRASDIVENGIR
jgi:hypothetical protein